MEYLLDQMFVEKDSVLLILMESKSIIMHQLVKICGFRNAYVFEENRGGSELGNNIYLESGCKIIGNVTIVDTCVVGAGTAVKSMLEKGIAATGVSSKK